MAESPQRNGEVSNHPSGEKKGLAQNQLITDAKRKHLTLKYRTIVKKLSKITNKLVQMTRELIGGQK